MKHSIYYYLYTHFTCHFFIGVKSVFITSFVLLFVVLYGSVIFVSYVLIRFCTSSLNAANNAASPVSCTATAGFLYCKALYKNCAYCSRVTVLAGSNFPSPVPDAIPFDCTALIAPSAQNHSEHH